MTSNKSNKQLIAISLLLAVVILFSKRVLSSVEVRPYLGFDKQLNHMRFKEKYGNNLFPKHYQQINVYGGLKFNNCWSTELGYISTASKNKYSTLYTGDFSLGAQVPEILSPATFKSYIKVRGFHLGIVNTFCKDEWENLRLLWGAGFSFLRAEAQRDGVSLGIPPIKGSIRTFKKQKAVLRLLGAAEYKFNNNLGVRGSVCFIQISKMVINAHVVPGSFTPIIRPKDSVICSVGAFFDF